METKQVKLNVNNKLDNKNNNTTKSDITVYEYEFKSKINVKIFQKSVLINKWVMYLIINLIALFSLTLIGFGLIVLINKSLPLNYGDHCSTSSECDQKYGTECSNGLCTCPVTHYYDKPNCDDECYGTKGLGCSNQICSCSPRRIWFNGSCRNALNYNQNCVSSSQCAPSLICQNGLCNCATTNLFWNGTYCDNTKTYMQSCLTAQSSYDNSSCSSTKGLYCSKSGTYAGYCACSDYYYFNSSLQQCTTQKLNGISCSNSYECRTDLGLICSSYNTCDCSPGYHWSSILTSCQSNAKYNQYCNASIQCDSSLLLSCQSNLCSCPTGYFFFETNCTKYFGQGLSCLNNAQCDASLGLSCNNNYCSCNSTQYWNNTICVNQLTYGSQCLINHQCISQNCLSATNSCSCPVDWDTFSTHCYTYIKDATLGLGWSIQSTWADANTNCQSLGGYLAVANSIAEFNFLSGLISSDVWIGAYQTTNWNWLDGTSLSSSSSWWCGGEPNGAGNGCTKLRNGGSCLDERSCSNTQNYICEFGN